MKKLALSLFSAGPFQRFHGLCRHPAKIRIGTDPTYAPFESKNAQGEWSVLISIWQRAV